MSFWETPYLPLPKLNVNTYNNGKNVKWGVGGGGRGGGLNSDC